MQQPNFQLTYGLRMDIPIIMDTPTANEPFAQYADTKGWNVKTNQRLASTPLWSPRVGFRGTSTRTADIYSVVVLVCSQVVSHLFGLVTTMLTLVFRYHHSMLTLQQDWNFCSILMARKQMQAS